MPVTLWFSFFMKKQYLLYGWLICLVLSCKITTKDLLHKEWYASEWVKNSDSINAESIYVTRFYKEGNYSQFSCKGYMYGKWSWDEAKSEITLQPEKGTLSKSKLIYSVAFRSANELEVVIKGEKEPLMLGTGRGFPWKGNVNKSSADPFSPAMNSWRTKPAAKETNEAVKERTKQYLQFLSVYHEHAGDNKFKLLLYGWFPRPIFMHYGNGCRMAYSNELSDWYPCFYDSTQAVASYQLIGGALRKTKIPKDDDKTERNMDIIGNMIKNLK